MRTVPSGWKPFQFRTDARYGFVVKLTDGTTNWWFATQEIERNVGAHIYGLLVGLSGIKHKFNPFNRTWSIGNVTVVLNNSPYRKDTNGNWIRPSDDLTGITGRAATIYIFCGEHWSNTMTRYRGIVSEEPTHDQQTCTIRLSDDTAWENTYLPNRKVSDVFTDYAREVSNKLVPLVYGKFVYQPHIASSTSGAAVGHGLAKCQYIEHLVDDQPGRFAVAAHRCYTSGHAYYRRPGLIDAGIFITYTIYNASTRQYIDVKTNTINISLLPDNQNWNGYNFSGQNKGVNPKYGYDLDDTTDVETWDNVQDNGTVIISENRVGFSGHETIAQIFESIANPGVSGFHYKIRYKAWRVRTLTNAYLRFYYDANASDVPIYYSHAINIDTLADNAWHYNADWEWMTHLVGRPILIALRVHSTVGADGTMNNDRTLDVFGMELYVQYKEIPSLEGANVDIWASVEGREFGAWIDVGGRSNNFNAGDLIQDPAYIIESLLRDELGFTDNDIDMNSFDAAHNYSTPSMLNLHNDNKAKISKIIKQLCEQSTFAFTYTSEGKIRLIDLDPSSPTAVRTIPYSHIIDGKITVGSANEIINRLNVESRYWQQIKEYRDKDIFNDASSQANGIREQSVAWPNLEEPSAVQHVAEHYVKASTGLWSNSHDEIIFEMAGVMYSDLEVGDWIEIDAITVDPHIKPHGVSWSGRLHMITETVQLLDRTRITAVKL